MLVHLFISINETHSFQDLASNPSPVGPVSCWARLLGLSRTPPNQPLFQEIIRMNMLRLTSLMSQNADPLAGMVASYLAGKLALPVVFVNVEPWQARERLLDAGEIQVGWICGYPYIRKVDWEQQPLELLAAPVMAHPRYGGRPIYFSDVVVHRESAFRTFADLRGANWAYNEPGSQSGYNVVRHHLTCLGEDFSYFGRMVESGAHLRSLQMILNREVDASALDSTVLEAALLHSPSIGREIRIIESMGPNPIPPWVIRREVDPTLRDHLRSLLLAMYEDPVGAAILAMGQMRCFAQVADGDYDAIRQMTTYVAFAPPLVADPPFVDP
jgi:phosphonate transport system substrate-binding protein